MIAILSHYQSKYHPDGPTRLNITGDGMSTMRAMDAIRACLNGPHDSARLHKTNVNVADWHEHVLMLQVCVPV